MPEILGIQESDSASGRDVTRICEILSAAEIDEALGALYPFERERPTQALLLLRRVADQVESADAQGLLARMCEVGLSQLGLWCTEASRQRPERHAPYVARHVATIASWKTDPAEEPMREDDERLFKDWVSQPRYRMWRMLHAIEEAAAAAAREGALGFIQDPREASSVSTSATEVCASEVRRWLKARG